MKKIFVMAAVMALGNLAFAQENYSEWAGNRAIRVNTSGAGANVPGNVSQFPLLVRLTTSNFPGFAQSAADGSDIRFTQPDGVQRIPHQIERWDAANQVADVWVLASTVAGNADEIVMRVYWGKSGAPDSSSGSAVFSTTNGFQAVFHMNENAGDTIRDATSNGFKGSPVVGAGAGSAAPSPVVSTTAGQYISGAYRDFPGSATAASVTVGGAYRLWTAATGSTATGLLSFNNAGTTVYSISFWMNVDNFHGANGQRRGIITKTNAALSGNPAATARQWHFRTLSGNNTFGGTNAFEFVDNSVNDSSLLIRSVDNTVTAAQWNFVTFARTSEGEAQVYAHNASGAFVDDRVVPMPPKPLNAAEQDGVNVFIGGFSNSTSATGANAGTGFFDGKLDEVRFSNVARSADWVKLSYETQKPGATAVTLTTDPISVFARADREAPGRLNVKASGRSLVFGLSRPAAKGTVVSIVDVQGRPVWSRAMEAGARELAWNGVAANGAAVAHGVYFARVSAGGGESGGHKFLYAP